MAEMKKHGALQEARRHRLPLAALPGGARARRCPRSITSSGRATCCKLGDGARRRRRAHARRQPRRLGRSARATRASSTDSRVERVREDRRGVQPHVRLLHHPGVPRQAALAPARTTSCARPSSSRRRGVVEMNLISQDTDRLRPRPRRRRPTQATLARARRRASPTSKGVRWVRLFYLYPETIDERARRPPREPPARRPVRRHAASARAPTRCSSACGAGTARIARSASSSGCARRSPGSRFRTAFIVGHPGETDEEFEELVEFVEWARVRARRRLPLLGRGVAPSRYAIDEKVQAARRREPLPQADGAAAQDRARRRTRARRPASSRCSSRGRARSTSSSIEGRHAGQAPDIDGKVFLSRRRGVGRARCAACASTQASDYDLVGDLVDASDARAGGAKKKEPRRVSLKVLGSHEHGG